MQVLVQKVGDVARIQHTQQIDHDKRQQEFVQAISQQTEHNTKEVNQMLKSEHAEIHQRQEKQKKEKNNQEKKGKSDNEANNDNKRLNPHDSGHLLDITI
ncbi:MAG: hypothetical protein ABFD08_10355 [Syntrophomonas sp.]